ncbi:TetR family transcriptional regulator [Streptomyces lasalocidi]
MARQERAVRTRRAVIEAAAAVFAERGYAAATIAEILERAGVTKGALYFHFDSKEALARGVIDAQITTVHWVPRELKLQEWVDICMTLAYRVPNDVVLMAEHQALRRSPGTTAVRQRLARVDPARGREDRRRERAGRGPAAHRPR